MKHLNRWTLSGAVAVVLGAGMVYATVPDAGGVIHGCFNRTKGDFRIIDNSTQQCSATEFAIQWNQQGPQGAAGLPGPQGATGPQGPQGATGPQGDAGASEAYSASQGSVQINDPDNVVPNTNGEVPVLALQVPAGSYVVTARVHVSTPVGMAGTRYITCTLWETNPTRAADHAFVAMVSPAESGMNGQATIPLVGAFQSAGGTMRIMCKAERFENSESVALAANEWIPADGHMTAVPVGTLHQQ